MRPVGTSLLPPRGGCQSRGQRDLRQDAAPSWCHDVFQCHRYCAQVQGRSSGLGEDLLPRHVGSSVCGGCKGSRPRKVLVCFDYGLRYKGGDTGLGSCWYYLHGEMREKYSAWEMQAARQETGVHDLSGLKHCQFHCKVHETGRSPEPQLMVDSKVQKRRIRLCQEPVNDLGMLYPRKIGFTLIKIDPGCWH